MMDFDPVTLARIQFAANISFHILFPTISIGLCWILLYFRTRFTLSGDKNWEFAYYFWVKVFALTFAIGVVSGITMSFQFGTNWPGFMERAGNIAGPLLGYEVLTAFFLEASFLGIMLFGKHRVSNRTHLIACSLVAIGTTFSAFWILSLNSWMQTPTGFIVEDGVFFVDSWLRVIFNPSFPYRLVHMIIASLLTSAFLVMGVSAWRMIRGVDGPATTLVFKTGLVIAMICAPLQIVSGDLHGLNTFEHQPAKIAAIEAIWETEPGAPFTLIGFPDEATQSTRAAIKIPYAASLILTHEMDGIVPGLDQFDVHPPVAPLFWFFRIMVALGLAMLAVSWLGGWRVFLLKKRPGPLMLKLFSVMTFSGWVAVLSGWYVTEIGRQPWIIDGLVRIDQVVADHGGTMVLSTLLFYLALYIFVLLAFIGTLRYMSSKPAASLIASQQQYPDSTHAGEGRV